MGAIILMLSAMFWMLIFSVIAYSEPINSKAVVIEPVYVVNPWMSPSAFKKLMKEVVVSFRADGIRVKLGRIIQKPDYISETVGRYNPELVGDPFQYDLAFWSNRFKLKKNSVKFIGSPPWMVDGVGDYEDGARPYFGGYAQEGKVKSGCVATGSMASYGYGGVPKLKQSLIIAKHETYHCLGANHLDSKVNIMNYGAAYYSEHPDVLRLMPESLEEIRNTLK